MSGFPILDLVAGFIFIYFLLSIISSAAVEMVLTTFKLRAKVLEKWLFTVFGETVSKEIANHPSITALSKKDKSTSYIDAKNFATVLIEKIAYVKSNELQVATTLFELSEAIKTSPILPPNLKRAFLVYAAEAKATFEQVKEIETNVETELSLFRTKIENWFDSSMDRVSGSLKSKYTRLITLVVSAIIVGFSNADSLCLAKYLYNNPSARIALAEKSYATGLDTANINQFLAKQKVALEKAKIDSLAASVDSIQKILKDGIATINTTKAALESSIPLGWTKQECTEWKNNKGSYRIGKLSGLAITVLAMMMGAPFWFDVLNKIANLRGSGKKPETSS